MSANIVIYNASAGSGKTYQLSLNYLKLLKDLSNNNLKNLLAITFTNKAAFEMKERVIQFLKEIIKNTERGKALKKELNFSEKEAEALLEEIFLNYDNFQVKTIDSFLLNLYKALAYELNLISDFQIKRYIDESLIEKALERVFEEAYQNKNLFLFLESFVEHLLKTQKQLKIDIKNKLVKSLETILHKITYKKELIEAINIYKERDLKEIAQFVNQEDLSQYSKDYYLTLYSLVKDKLEEIFYKEKTLFIGLWKEKLSKFISSQDGFIPWIYVKLGSLEGIIIDEFQDTDRLQWEAILPIVEDLISRNKFLICAGDPKQSIFQWRGGDPFLLQEILDKFSSYSVKVEILNKNYRSCSNLVNFNNLFFSVLKNNKELKKEILAEIIFGKNDKFERKEEVLQKVLEEFDRNFRHIQQEPTQNLDGEVNLRFIKLDSINSSDSKKYNKIRLNDLIKDEILNILEELKNRENFEDVAILVRKNEEITELSSFLLTQGFKVIGTSFLKLKESKLVNSFVSLLKFLNYPEDNIALAGFLNGGFTQKGEDIFKSYCEAKLRGINLNLIDFVKTEFKDFWKVYIEDLLNKSKILSFYELCQYISNVFRLKEKEEVSYLYKFLSIILDLSSKGGDLEDFLEYWEKYSEDELEIPKDKEAIKILTIHLAKGLEFKHVILPLTWEEKEYTADLGLIFYNGKIYKGKKEELPEEAIIGWYLDKAKQKLEIFNLLYVAFTRAIKNLYIILPEEELKNFKMEGFKIFRKVYAFLEKEKDFSINSFNSL